MLRIIDIDYLENYKLSIEFNDGVRKTVDLEPYLTGEVFGELRDKNKFIQYGLTSVTIEWANGANLAPEFLYEIGTENKYDYLHPAINLVAEPDAEYLKKEDTGRQTILYAKLKKK